MEHQMSIDIEGLKKKFNDVRDEAYEFRRNDPNGDGREFWQKFKKKLERYDDQLFSMVSQDTIAEQKRPEVLGGMIGKTLHPENKTDPTEEEHFLAQTLRLIKPEASPRKIVQIALNIGQFNGLMKNKCPENPPEIPWCHFNDYVVPQ